MTRLLFSCLLLIYYWYFYAYKAKAIKVPSIGSPSKPDPYKFEFISNKPNHFQFTVNGKVSWEHTFPADTFIFHENKIVPLDGCHGFEDGHLIPAKGETLYEYINNNIGIETISNFKEKSQFNVSQGDVFYFKCSKGRIESLEMCPSGTTLVEGRCQSINVCTNKPDGTLLPKPPFIEEYIACHQETVVHKKCPPDHFFNYNRCEYMNDLNNFCNLFPDGTRLIDDVTLLKCRNGRNDIVKCKSGTRFFENDFCEPDDCVGKPDGTQVPLIEQKIDGFKFTPGYGTCHNNKIQRTVNCPKKWDTMLSKGDDLTFLPMVFDGQTCSVPTFCENVFSDDPETIVPLHEFTKHVRNWSKSTLMDHSAGFTCENKIRKRKAVEPGTSISKRFKMEPACTSRDIRLPIYEDPKHYYDCMSQSVMPCPNSTFFNGWTCEPEPRDAFYFHKIPFFQFDSLNHESWIKAWDYYKGPIPSCVAPNQVYNKLYNVCSHPDCEKYAFISQIPEMAILLPFEHRAKCKYYETERTLKKEPVDFEYQFWNQRIVDQRHDEICQPGQKLQSGNLIWDSTVYATCDMDVPFIFCPSHHTKMLLSKNDKYLNCEPPQQNGFIFNRTDWTPFETNEIKRILPIDPQNTMVRINKSKKEQLVPADGLEIPLNTKVNLLSNKPLMLEPRYRVTYPPNVGYKYDHNTSEDYSVLSTSPNHGFLMKAANFTNKSLNFPRYTSINFVQDFNSNLYV